MAPTGPTSRPGANPRPVGSSPARALIGQTLGPYKVQGIVAEGGMGVVYHAEHTLIGRKAAIKVLSTDVAQDQESVSRFFTEARAVNQIRHPNIVAITDFGTFGDHYYIVMERLEGETLAERLERERILDPITAVHIARQIASALGAAHEVGLVHRDLKPANIFLSQHPDYPDFVKILDFGIAKLLSPRLDPGYRTKVGSLLGTPSYMSPEQCLGDATLDHRSDIYSLGVVIYLMVTGQLPFEEDSLGRLILSHVNQTPRPPWSVHPAVSQPMSAVILRALEKRPQERFQSMRELRRALDETAGFDRAPSPGSMSGALPLQPLSIGESSDALQLGRRLTPDKPPPVVRLQTSERLAVTVAYSEPSPEPVSAPTPRVAPGHFTGTGADAEETLVARLIAVIRQHFTDDGMGMPELPPVAATCLSRLRLPGLSMAQIAATLREDRPLVARLIRAANSAPYTSRSNAETLELALARLGTQGLQQVLVEQSARPLLESADPRVRASFREPWRHALAVATLCERLVLAFHQPDMVAAAYLAGLVHDLGRILVADYLCGLERQRPQQNGQVWLTDSVLHRAVDATFRQVSLALGQRWHLPQRSVLAIERCQEATRERHRSLGAVLALALALAKREGYYLRASDLDDVDLLVDLARRSLGLDVAILGRVTQGLHERVRLVAEVRGR